jgi:hypothetical protein
MRAGHRREETGGRRGGRKQDAAEKREARQRLRVASGPELVRSKVHPELELLPQIVFEW